MKIRNRVKSLRTVRAGDLVPNPKNWRTHPEAQADALRGILAEVGYADALLARELPDGTLMLVDGHLRAETTPDAEVPVLILDIDEAEADKLLLTLDPLAALAESNKVALDELLRSVDTGSDGLQQMYADLAKDAGLYGTELADDGVASTDEPEVGFSIGEVRFKVSREAYNAWLEEARQAVGFDEDSLVAEFQRRLGLSP
jgi:hypothetical protein